MTKESLKEILDKHLLWIEGEEDGVRANLSGADLWGANLSGGDLSGGYLSKANLSKADLSGANLSGAKKIMAFGPMPTIGRIIYAVRHDSGWMVQAGCFWGDIDKLESKVKESHNCPVYIAIINLLRSIK